MPRDWQGRNVAPEAQRGEGPSFPSVAMSVGAIAAGCTVLCAGNDKKPEWTPAGGKPPMLLACRVILRRRPTRPRGYKTRGGANRRDDDRPRPPDARR